MFKHQLVSAAYVPPTFVCEIYTRIQIYTVLGKYLFNYSNQLVNHAER
jgi:hypothetical protein